MFLEHASNFFFLKIKGAEWEQLFNENTDMLHFLEHVVVLLWIRRGLVVLVVTVRAVSSYQSKIYFYTMLLHSWLQSSVGPPTPHRTAPGGKYWSTCKRCVSLPRFVCVCTDWVKGCLLECHCRQMINMKEIADFMWIIKCFVKHIRERDI